MPSAIYAYAFLKAAYSEGIRNPVDAVVPLVKRALMRLGSSDIDQQKVQQRIKNSIGLEIPLNVIRYSFPHLAATNILKLENHIYKLVDPNYVDPDIVQLEQDSREQYDRIKAKINRFFIDYNVKGFDPDGFIEEWLDESCLSFLGGANPAFSAQNKDREINRLMFLIINENDSDGQFLTDLTGVALGDSLYRAIRAITEYDTADNSLSNLPSKMDGVGVYFDTRFVMRALGFGFQPLMHAANELLSLCKSTGCRIHVFRHNVSEIQRVIRTVADKMYYGGNIEGDIAAYSSEHGFDPADLIELASNIEDKILAAGFEILDAPPISAALSVDETALDAQLKLDLRQATDQARITDVSSLTAIYRLRDGQPKRYLEKCEAIFVTTNKGLADSSLRYFQPLFKEMGEANRVQICMTDVVFSTRLWTKLPTSLDKLPRDQIIAHIMGYLRPSQRLKEDFVRHLRAFVSEGNISEEMATKIRLSRFVEQALAVEFEAGKTVLTRTEFINVAKLVIEKQKALQEKIKESVEIKVRAEVQKELDGALDRFRQAEGNLIQKDESIDELRKEIALNSVHIESMTETSERVQKNVAKLLKWLVRTVGALCVFWVFDTLFSATAVVEAFLVRVQFIKSAESLGAFRTFLNLFAAAIFSLLTLAGLSLSGAQKALESTIVKRIMHFIYSSS